jgi:ribosomal protein S18 acetylase RimI-like enzyme
MNVFEISIASEKDIPIIQSITADVWPQTYSPIISKEQIDYMLNEMYSTTALQHQLNEGHRFLIVRKDETAIGFCSFGVDKKAGDYKLHKLYIRLTEQSRGAGSVLLEEVIRLVKEQGGKHLFLQVNRNNTKAIQFYQFHHFIIEEELDLNIGNGFQMNDYIMGILF